MQWYDIRIKCHSKVVVQLQISIRSNNKKVSKKNAYPYIIIITDSSGNKFREKILEAHIKALIS